MLHVCTTCRAGRDLAEGETPPGQIFFDSVAARLGHGTADDIELRPVVCLSVCKRGCGAAISMPGKWTYLLGHLGPDLAADLLIYARTYTASKTGTVLPSRRPASLADIVVGRVPALDTAS